MAELDEELDEVSEAKARAAQASDDAPTELGAEFNTLFGDADFDINSIPDRDANELSEDELARIADMQLDDLLDGTDTVSLESLFGDNKDNSEENGTTAVTDVPAATESNLSEVTENSTGVEAVPTDEIEPISDAELADLAQIAGVADLGSIESIDEPVNGNSEATPDANIDDSVEDITEIDEEISAAQLLGFSTEAEDVLDEATPIDNEDEMSGKKPKKKKKKSKKDEPKLEDGLPKKTFGQKLKGLFFEIDDTGSDIEASEEEDDKPHNVLSDNEDELDENEKLLKSMYGKDIDGAPLDEENAGAEKLGFFAKLKMLFAKKKAQNAIEEQEEEEAEAIEAEEKKVKKEEKKAASAEKKAAAKAEKEAKKKEPKPEKPKKEPKPKKVKEPPKPGDILKIKPKAMIALVLFVAGAVILINLASSTFNYNNAVSKAKVYFQNGNYAKAYDELSGMTLDEADMPLFDQVYTIMILEKQCNSYENFIKIKDNTNALNSLIKGIAKYQKFLPKAEKLGVGIQFEAAKERIVGLLKDNYGISYEKACEYVTLSEKDFVQYYHTIETYGGK